jgi:hypothetical protein
MAPVGEGVPAGGIVATGLTGIVVFFVFETEHPPAITIATPEARINEVNFI